nr:C2 calcium-dependent domain-containing protein 4D [Pogona vitticeps]
MFSRKKNSISWPVCPNVITPDKIPTFFIPPNLATLQGRRLCRSASPESCRATDPSSEQQGNQDSGRLHGASSMPQLSSPMGVPFLPESPHTRRRESLFHSGRAPRRCPFAKLYTPPTRPLLHHGLAAESDSPSSAETSPYSSPLLARSPGSPPSCQGYGQHRRLASRSASLSPAPRPSSLSLEETSSTDTSPSFPRRGKEPSWKGGGGTTTATTPPPLLPAFPLDLIRCRERITKEVMLTVSQGGRLRLSSEYLQAQGCLRIRVVSAEAFYPSHCNPRHIHCCVSLYLRPGTGPRQRSAIVKKSRNPIFNEDFFFEGVSPEELPRLSLRIKVLNKGSGMRRDAVLGECDVPLDSLLP